MKKPTNAVRNIHHSGLTTLLEVMSKLRNPNTGCPWDIRQTSESIASYSIEEAYELEEAIHSHDPIKLKDELGDLLFQIVFHAAIAEEKGTFNFDDVSQSIANKMIRRHPHVFGARGSETAITRELIWEDLKETEREAEAMTQGLARPSALEGVAKSLPALTRAYKIQKRAARVGFDWSSYQPVFDKLIEEVNELKHELENYDGTDAKCSEELGDVLFTCVNLARHLGIDAEKALRNATSKFEDRFKAVESDLSNSGKAIENASRNELHTLWENAKGSETKDRN